MRFRARGPPRMYPSPWEFLGALGGSWGGTREVWGPINTLNTLKHIGKSLKNRKMQIFRASDDHFSKCFDEPRALFTKINSILVPTVQSSFNRRKYMNIYRNFANKLRNFILNGCVLHEIASPSSMEWSRLRKPVPKSKFR